MLRIFCCILLCLTASPLSAGDESDKFFADTGPLPLFKIEVAKERMEQLKAEPRKHVRATVQVGNKIYKDVGVHLKGAAGSFRELDDCPAWTLEFNKFESRQLFHGLDRIHLNNSVQDPRYMTEILVSRMMLAAGVPTARATHALVKFNDEPTRLVVLKEGYNDVFLRRHFGSTQGNLYDGGFLKELDGDLKRSHGHRDVTDGSDLKAAAAAARESDLAERLARLDKLVDLDRFMKMIAIEVLTWHWDGYAMHKNNYRIYHDLKTGKLVFMPHGMDQMWSEPKGPIQPKFEGLIARRLMQTTEGKERYRKSLSEMLDKVHKTEELHKQIDAMVERLEKHLPVNDNETLESVVNGSKELKAAIQSREDFVRKKLKS